MQFFKNMANVAKVVKDPRLKKAIKRPKIGAMYLITRTYNAVVDRVEGNEPNYIETESKELNEVKKKSLKRTEISDHLETLFIKSLSIKPKLIVELGVSYGKSTFVFERVARLCKSNFVSVDINDCSGVCQYGDWHFIQKDDIAFAREFKEWCKARNINPMIDILFIDTSHIYEHTVQEIQHWFPFLSEKAIVFFHDTNLSLFVHRKDKSITSGWNNQRGVIRALEDYFDKQFNEKKDFIDFRKGWLITHYSHSSGFTILESGWPCIKK